MDDTSFIFLSYRSTEREFALKLAADLKNAGLRLWMDVFEIKTGDNWNRRLQDGVDACAGMIAILSPEYVESVYCRRELQRASERGVPIYPVLLRPHNDAKKDWPFEIQEKHYIDFTIWLDEKTYQKQFATLGEAIKGRFSGQMGDIPDPETRYLTTLIAQLESARGVLEYVDLAAEAAYEQRPKPRPDDEWGFARMLEALEVRNDYEIQRMGPKVEPLATIAEAVAKFPRFVLVGDPGAGKTTTIRRLARDAARLRLENPRTAPLPLLLYLPQWDKEPTALDFVRSQWPFDTDPAGLLQNGDVLLYLDGLNEMGADGERKAGLLREWFKKEDGPQKVIVTCRVGDYRQKLKLDDMATVLAQPLSDEQIIRVAENYLKDRVEGFLRRVFPEDESRDEQERSLRHLARNPYMLGALTFIYEDSKSGDLPTNNGALFRALAWGLWEREWKRGTLGNVTKAEAEQQFTVIEEAFGRLAFAMIDDGMPIDVPMEYAVKKLGDEILLRLGQSASFITVQGKQIRFCHHLMLEYFAARGLLETGVESYLPWFDIDGIVTTNWEWSESIIALCGIIDDASAIVQQVALHDPFLAAECIASSIAVSESVNSILMEQLIELLSDSDERVSYLAAQALGHFKNPRIISALLKAFRETGSLTHDGAAQALEKMGLPAVPELIEALYDRDARVRTSAADILGVIKAAKAVPGLLIALSDTSADVRRAAAEALGQIEEQALPKWLESLPDYKTALSKEELEELSQHVGVVASLLDALHDKAATVRGSGVEALGLMRADAAVPSLINCLNDTAEIRSSQSRVCDFAAEALEKIGTPEALAAVRKWREEQCEE